MYERRNVCAQSKSEDSDDRYPKHFATDHHRNANHNKDEACPDAYQDSSSRTSKDLRLPHRVERYPTKPTFFHTGQDRSLSHPKSNPQRGTRTSDFIRLSGFIRSRAPFDRVASNSN